MCGKKRNLFALLLGMETGASSVTNNMEASQKNKKGLHMIHRFHSGYISKELKTAYRKVVCILMFIAQLFTTAEIWKQPKHPPTDEWRYIRHRCYSALKKAFILIFAAT